MKRLNKEQIKKLQDKHSRKHALRRKKAQENPLAWGNRHKLFEHRMRRDK